MRANVLLLLEIIRAWTPSPRPRRCTALRAHPAFKQKKDPKYSLEAAVEAGEAAQRASVPQSFDDVLDEMGASVAAALDAGGARFLVECLPPGLNPELEMTCPYDPSRELAVVQALLNAIPRRVIRVRAPRRASAAMACAVGCRGMLVLWFVVAPGAIGPGRRRQARVWESAGRARRRCEAAELGRRPGDRGRHDLRRGGRGRRRERRAAEPRPRDEGRPRYPSKGPVGGVRALVRAGLPLFQLVLLRASELPQIERGLVRLGKRRAWEDFHDPAVGFFPRRP